MSTVQLLPVIIPSQVFLRNSPEKWIRGQGHKDSLTQDYKWVFIFTNFETLQKLVKCDEILVANNFSVRKKEQQKPLLFLF